MKNIWKKVVQGKKKSHDDAVNEDGKGRLSKPNSLTTFFWLNNKDPGNKPYRKNFNIYSSVLYLMNESQGLFYLQPGGNPKLPRIDEGRCMHCRIQIKNWKSNKKWKNVKNIKNWKIKGPDFDLFEMEYSLEKMKN